MRSRAVQPRHRQQTAWLRCRGGARRWYGIGAPRLTPEAIIHKLNNEINAALAEPNVKARVADLGGSPLALSPAEFRKFIFDDTDKWAKLIRAAKIKPD
jgi:tripartite-type tricarboxylate transporter receptor subunit TctC